MHSSSRLAPATQSHGRHGFELAFGPEHHRTIEQSHLRCAAMGLTESSIPELNPASVRRAQLAVQQHQRLFEHATPVMEMLFEQILSTKSMVALTDTEGNVLQAIGDNSFLDRVQQVALAPGVNWAESTKGTNAVGTALFTETPTQVHADEHFLRAHHFLTCSAVPIFDHAGHMMGVLDVSGHWQSYHPHTLAMATMSARMIENHWFSDKFRNGLRLHFHGRAQMLGTMREGMMALSPDGAILGANRNAIELLGLNVPAMRKLGLEGLFGITVGTIAEHCRRLQEEPMRLHPQHGDPAGSPPFFARAVFNWPTFWPAFSLAAEASPAAAAAMPVRAVAGPEDTVPRPATLEAQELAAIRHAVDAAGGNISKAARQLGVARNTVYRRLRAASPQGESGADKP